MGWKIVSNDVNSLVRSHRSLYKGKKSKLLAAVLSRCKSNEELSWINHVKIISHSNNHLNNQTRQKKKTIIPMLLPYSLSTTLKNTFSLSNLTEILPHFVLQLNCYS